MCTKYLRPEKKCALSSIILEKVCKKFVMSEPFAHCAHLCPLLVKVCSGKPADGNDQTGPLDGSVSISVGSFTEYDRMGTGVVKSSKCHPDSIKSQGALLKPKRLRDRRADSENQPPDQPPEPSRADLKKQASEAKVKRDALARSNRAMIRLGMEDWTASRLADETQVAEPFHPGPEDCFIVESDRV